MKIRVGIGTIQYEIGSGWKKQLAINSGSLVANSIGLLNAVGQNGKVKFDNNSFQLYYKGGITKRLNLNGVSIYAPFVNGGITDVNHEIRHVWQQRAMGYSFFGSYFGGFIGPLMYQGPLNSGGLV